MKNSEMIVVRECYREMLILEDKYAGSVFHKYENFDEHRTWHFSSAVFFAMTLFTTIGYGTIACQTVAGKVVTIIYSVIGIPLMLMVLGDIGRTLFGMMTKFYNSSLRTFRFQSLATIGLGDVVPNNIKYNPFVSLMIIFGLALLSLVNGTVYRKVERKFLAYIDRFESWLQNLRIQRPLPQGYTVFRHLSPNIQLLALALPIFDNMEEANIHEMLDPRNTKVGRWAFADHTRSRSTTLPTAQPPHTATLGIFATTSTKARSTTFSNYHSTRYGCNTSRWKISAINGPTSDYMRRIQLRRVLSENDEECLIVQPIPSRSRAATRCL
uniref:Potassium channel domain-containing protein n=1 Tax=Ascaris lumbricoides TaxID=6252 RepID=A0A9J2P9B9_ASCLU